MTTPRKRKCHHCKVDLTARRDSHNRLRAPPRFLLTAIGPTASVGFALCPTCFSNSPFSPLFDMKLEGAARGLDP